MKTDPKNVATEEFFFSGSGEFEPMTIVAANLTEATARWEKERKAQGAATPAPAAEPEPLADDKQ